MANTFKNFRNVMVTGSGTTNVYICPTATTAILLHCQVANVDTTGTNSADATVGWTKSLASDALTHLAKAVTVPAKTSLSVLTGKLVLMAGDGITAIASADEDLVLSGSVLEIS